MLQQCDATAMQCSTQQVHWYAESPGATRTSSVVEALLVKLDIHVVNPYNCSGWNGDSGNVGGQ